MAKYLIKTTQVNFGADSQLEEAKIAWIVGLVALDPDPQKVWGNYKYKIAFYTWNTINDLCLFVVLQH